MIDLTGLPLSAIQPALLDFGYVIRASTGAATERHNRKGNRYRVGFVSQPMAPTMARAYVAKLLKGKSEGVRIPFPLEVPQGSPGAPLVDGSGQAGTSLAIKGLTPGYRCRAGFWLSIIDASGQHYLHNIYTGGMAGSDGKLTVVLDVPLRTAFANNAVIHLAKPMVEGFVDGEEWSWSRSVDRRTPVEFVIEEAG